MSYFDLFKYDIIDLNLYNNQAIKLDTSTENEQMLQVCKVCGRKLHNTDSCICGMGPVCYKKYKSKLLKSHKLF